MTIMTFMMINSMLMIFLKHPLSMGFSILSQAIFTALYIGSIYLNFWYSYILMLIMIGGLLILFIYMTSIASNEKFKFNYKLTILILFFFYLMILMKINFNYENNYINMFTNLMNSELSMNNNFYYSMSKYMNFPQMKITLIIIIYLLISMIMVVKICKIKSGPLRQMF